MRGEGGIPEQRYHATLSSSIIQNLIQNLIQNPPSLLYTAPARKSQSLKREIIEIVGLFFFSTLETKKKKKNYVSMYNTYIHKIFCYLVLATDNAGAHLASSETGMQ